jgi:hypothetical protein
MINWLAFIAEMKSVYSAVRTGSLNKAACASSVKGSRKNVNHGSNILEMGKVLIKVLGF